MLECIRFLRAPRAALLLTLVFAAGCGDDSDRNSADLLWPAESWIEQAPEDQGMDSTVLQGAREYAFQEGKHTQGVVIVRRGALVAEWYADESDADSWATSWSIAKSFTSALIGIALDEGLIPDVDVSMARYIPAWSGTAREAITLRDVLWMSSGLQWTEEYDDLTSDIAGLVLRERDPLSYVASREVGVAPGTVFNYSSGDTLLLSAVLEAATGMSAAAFAEQRIFAPLGMQRAEWWSDRSGHTLTFCCIDSTARDFARFGLLFLRKGRWRDATVVPPRWVEESTTSSPAYIGYGYQWWLLGEDTPGVPPDTYAAIGVDGQYIYVVPGLDLVVVRSGRYAKAAGPAVADPVLYPFLPAGGLFPGRGTVPPDEWDDGEFLAPIVASIREAR